MEDEIVQPNYALRVVPVGKKFQRGPTRLKELGFDPLANQIEIYKKLCQEVKFWEDIRDGSVVQVMDNGKTRYYNAEAHMSAYEKMIKIGSDLMRYGYSRVPEGVDPSRPAPPPLIINLRSKGEKFSINAGRDIPGEAVEITSDD